MEYQLSELKTALVYYCVQNDHIKRILNQSCWKYVKKNISVLKLGETTYFMSQFIN